MIQSIFEICEKEYPLSKNLYNNEISLSQSSKSIELNLGNKSSENSSNSIPEYSTETNEKIDKNLKKKYELQKAAEKFNYKIKSGIAYLKEVVLSNCTSIDAEAKGIVKFLRYTPSLKKKNIGEFLGENTELSLKTLKYFGGKLLF